MSIHMKILPLLVAALLGIAGCQGKQSQSTTENGAKVLARVNGAPLTADDISFQLKEGHSAPPKYGEKTIDDVIDQELLSQQAVQLKLDQDPSFRSKLAKLQGLPPGAKRQELARRVFNTQIAAKVDVSFKDAQDYYDKNADRIATELHLEMIKFENREQAEEALKKLHGGVSFESLAGDVMGKTPVKGRKPWDLGYLKWEKIPVDFVEAIYKLKPGEISEILGTNRTGFQVVKLVAARRIPKPDYPAVSSIVMNRLRDLKLLETYNHYVADLRKNAKIVKF